MKNLCNKMNIKNHRASIVANIKDKSYYNFINSKFSIFAKMRTVKLEGISVVYRGDVVVDAPTLENIVLYTHPSNQFMGHRQRIKRAKWNYAYANILRSRVTYKLVLRRFLSEFYYNNC